MGGRHDVRRLLELYRQGVNITEHLRTEEGAALNSETAILYAYDVQAGSYVKALDDPAYAARKRRVAARVAEVLAPLRFDTMLDAGTGEATTLSALLSMLPAQPGRVLAFDLSLSRLLFARDHLGRHGLDRVELFTGALESIPLADASVDLVLTVHVCEPNGGREREILAELLRVTRRYLVLIEPSYELAPEEARRRMDRLGYVRGLPDHLAALGASIVRQEPFGADLNPLNPASVLVVDRGVQNAAGPSEPTLVSPLSGWPLARGDGCLYSADGFAFPVIAGIACLLPENAVLAARMSDFTGAA